MQAEILTMYSLGIIVFFFSGSCLSGQLSSSINVAAAVKDEPVIINNNTVTDIPPVTEVDPPIPNSPKPTSTVSPSPTTPNTTTPIPTTTSSTTTTTSAPTTPTTPASTTTSSTPSTPASTSVKPPTPSTTQVPSSTVSPLTTTAAPHHDSRKFDGPSFVGGIILALGLVAIGFVAFKFYKARTELNYHTL